MPDARSPTDGRTEAQLRQHYDVERELARKLRTASRADRRHLYSELYDELYRRVPSHPQLTRQQSASARAATVRQLAQLIGRFTTADTTFMEIGAGDCALSVELASSTRQVYAIDVSDKVLGTRAKPHNFAFALSDGCSMPVPAGSIDLAFSNQLMEHLHPDDANEQLVNIYAALAPGGQYLCITPNRLTGPHDISRFFDDVATGFHLHEYTTGELIDLFDRTGFTRTKVYASIKGRYVRMPASLIRLGEALLLHLPPSLRKRITRFRLVNSLLGIQLLGVK